MTKTMIKKTVRKYPWITAFVLMTGLFLLMRSIPFLYASDYDDYIAEVENFFNAFNRTNFEYMRLAYSSFKTFTTSDSAAVTALRTIMVTIADLMVVIYSLINIVKETQRGEISMDYWFKIAASVVIAILLVTSVGTFMDYLYGVGDYIVTAVDNKMKDDVIHITNTKDPGSTKGKKKRYLEEGNDTRTEEQIKKDEAVEAAEAEEEEQQERKKTSWEENREWLLEQARKEEEEKKRRRGESGTEEQTDEGSTKVEDTIIEEGEKSNETEEEVTETPTKSEYKASEVVNLSRDQKIKILAALSTIPGFSGNADGTGNVLELYEAENEADLSWFNEVQGKEAFELLKYVVYAPLLICIFLIFSSMFEVRIRQIFAPIAVATIAYEGARASGVRFLKKYLSCFVKISMYFLIAALGSEMTIYFMIRLVNEEQVQGTMSPEMTMNLLMMIGSNIIAAMTMMQTGGLGDEIVGV